MAAEDDLRLAWQADRDGRPGARDALLTLAAASADPAASPWAGRCRDRIAAARPGHPFAAFPSLEAALTDGGVLAYVMRLRAAFPPARVRWLLLRDAARRGPYLGRGESLRAVTDDLFGPVWPAHLRPHSPEPAHAPRALRMREAALVGARLGYGRDDTPGPDPDEPPSLFEGPSGPRAENEPDDSDPETRERVRALYLAVLLAVAALLADVVGEDGG